MQMVFNSAWVATVARASAEWCQYIACNPERLPAEQVLDILCCLPIYHLHRLALCVYYFCFPPYAESRSYYFSRRYYSSSSSSYFSRRYYSSSSSSEDGDDDYDSAGYNSHSD